MFERVNPLQNEELPVSIEVDIETEALPVDDMVEFEDGSMGYEKAPQPEPVAFNANLALTISDNELSTMGLKLLQDIDEDKMSRKDWEESYTKGLSLLGMKSEEMTEPWPGACGLFHTMVAEAVVRFQSNAIMEIFPPSVPCKTSFFGLFT